MELWGCVGYLPQVIVAVQHAMGLEPMYELKEFNENVVGYVVEANMNGIRTAAEIEKREGETWSDVPLDL